MNLRSHSNSKSKTSGLVCNAVSRSMQRLAVVFSPLRVSCKHVTSSARICRKISSSWQSIRKSRSKLTTWKTSLRMHKLTTSACKIRSIYLRSSKRLKLTGNEWYRHCKTRSLRWLSRRLTSTRSFRSNSSNKLTWRASLKIRSTRLISCSLKFNLWRLS